MQVAGIDTSLTGTGVADRNGTLFSMGSPPTTMDLRARHARLSGLSGRILGAVGDGLDLVLIEQPAYSKAVGHMHDRSGLWWMLVDDLLTSGAPLIEVSPSALKKYASGKGNATKADMRMALFQRAGLDERNDNKVDAWWLRAFGMHLLGAPLVDLPKKNLEALAGFEVPTLTGAVA